MRTLPEMAEEELSNYYPQDYWGGEPTKEWLALTQADKVRTLRQCGLKGGRILDVGCGAGFFLSVLDERKWQRYGIEISPQAAEKAARTFGKENIYNGTLLDASFEAASFDVITFWSALEHMNDPRANLLQAHRLLKAGGSVVIEVPNNASYQAEHFKGDWFALDAPRHRYHFTPQTLGKALQETGFEVYYQTFQSRLHNAHALRQSLKRRLWKKSPFGSAAFLLAIPFLKLFDYLMSSRRKGATLTIAARTI
jgi:2-polyprenyl-3-methyl-5-hydroxy-6-metoxy-1,4-benzoquinol methylase